jgi:hypothetical protein
MIDRDLDPANLPGDFEELNEPASSEDDAPLHSFSHDSKIVLG